MSDKLNEYFEKRDFSKTSEPRGKTEESKHHLRFVVQHHMARAEHYDFRLEWEGTMLSWAVPKGPSFNTRDKRLAVKVEDHPLDYRNFEGTIPKGEYGGGTVMIWDEGYWEPLVDVEEGLKKGELKFTLKGGRLKGNWALIKWKSKSDKSRDNWLLLKEKDEYVKDNDGIAAFTTSIRSGRSMEDIKEGKKSALTQNPFQKAEAQLAMLVDEMPQSDEWVYEVKYDGYRIIAYIQNNQARLMTRNHLDYADRFSAIANTLIDFAQGRSMVLDGEVAVLDEDGKTSFQALQQNLKNKGNFALTYIVFDLLALDGEDLRQLPLVKRKETLEKLLKNAPPQLHFSHYMKREDKLFKAACQANLEGIVSKKAKAVYTGGRDGSWIKIKCIRRQEFVIGGYTLTDKRSSGVSALLLGAYEDDKLVYVGRAGTGISEDEMAVLEQKFKGLITKNPAFANPPKERSNEKITWLKPEVVAEIKFAEWTDDNLLRQASYQGLRTDKDAKDVKNDRLKDLSSIDAPSGEPLKKESKKAKPSAKKEADLPEIPDGVEGIKITHPEKIVYTSPRLTKMDVVSYYQQVAESMLPYIENRVLSAVRCPKGIAESCFFLKHPGTQSEHINRIQIDEKSGDADDYFYIDDAAGLVYEVQMGTIEFHTWGSKIQKLEQPDVMVFDLDPDEGVTLEKVRQGVRDLKSLLDELSLTSFLKTSGGKGYHVVVPIKPSVGWDRFHDFAKSLAGVMESKWPERYTANIRKEKRKGKIFIDWIRNGRGATSVAPYSVRARIGAKVSLPIAWDELDLIAPDDITMDEAILRIDKKDPWEGFYETDQMLQ